MCGTIAQRISCSFLESFTYCMYACMLVFATNLLNNISHLIKDMHHRRMSLIIHPSSMYVCIHNRPTVQATKANRKSRTYRGAALLHHHLFEATSFKSGAHNCHSSCQLIPDGAYAPRQKHLKSHQLSLWWLVVVVVVAVVVVVGGCGGCGGSGGGCSRGCAGCGG